MITAPWSEADLEHVRRRAVALWRDGLTPAEVASALGVSARSVQRWAAAWSAAGGDALSTKPRPGRPPKLTPRQAARVLGWIDRSPTAFGFATERWTAPRVATLVAERLGVRMHPRYLNDWLRRHGPVTPQVPERRARERDEAGIARWVRRRWPAVKKRRGRPGRPCCSPTRAGSNCCRWSGRRWPRGAARPS